MSSNKILVSDSIFLECIDELATQITEERFGDSATIEVESSVSKNFIIFTEEAQDFYNERFDEYETLINNTLNVWNKQREI
tara:strand:- start:184 stop:426 length:243 start_codon:yes stop_codon:yes gene_type:complete